jgi:hypothetical protein
MKKYYLNSASIAIDGYAVSAGFISLLGIVGVWAGILGTGDGRICNRKLQ